MKSIINLSISFVFLSLSLRANNTSVHFSFDSLFPSTPYKKILTMCMQIRSTMPMLEQYKDFDEDYQTLSDLMAGRMIHLKSAIEALLENKVLIHTDDVEYLLAIMHCMQSELACVFKSKSQDKACILNTLLDDIKNRIESFLYKKVYV